MDAATNTGVPAPDKSSHGEFVVHTKHTCDTCYIPIIGKRYTSSAHSNYDLCARCFGAYSGKDIGLTEAVLVRDKKHSHNFVLKLKVNNEGDEQVRRVNVSEIWGKSISRLSFGKLMSIASSYAFPYNKVDDAALAPFIAKAKATYIDEDGDKITMTSNAELEDAFRQVLKKFPIHKPFRISVTIPQDKSKKIFVAATGKARGVPKCPPFRLASRLGPPMNSGKPVFMHASKPSPPMDGKSRTTLRVAPQKFEKDFFVHARHTCDGCSKSPIIGTRYHATKIPDFDLCGTCFKKYEGEDLDFKPEIQDRDRRMQTRWLKKQLNSKMPSSSIAGTWNQANGEDIADFLKKVQESGGVIESATLLNTSPPCEGFPCLNRNNSTTPTDGTPVGDATDSLKETEEPAKDEVTESVKNEESAKVEDNGSVEDEESVKVEDTASICPSVATSGVPTDEKAPGSPVPSQDESFFSEADGIGSVAEAIGRTLDVCVQAIEEAMDDMEKVDGSAGTGEEKSQKSPGSKASTDENAAAAAAFAVDAFSVCSSMVSSNLTEVLKRMEEAKKVDDASHAVLSQSYDTADADASTGVPSVVTGATILKAEMPKVEDASDEEDEWSVVSDDKSQVKNSKTAVFDWDMGQGTPKAEEEEADKSVSSVEPLSPVLLAKWDTELHQLHELGFLHDRKNVDVLEALEASHVAVDSTEKVTINAALGRLLGDR